MDAALR